MILGYCRSVLAALLDSAASVVMDCVNAKNVANDCDCGGMSFLLVCLFLLCINPDGPHWLL